MNTAINFFTRNRIYLFLHILAWAILFVLPIYLIYVDSSNDDHFIRFAYLQTFCYILIFYINYFLLVPKLFFVVKRRLIYFFSAIIIIIGFSLTIEIVTGTDFFSEKTKLEFKPSVAFIEQMKNEPKRPKPSKKWPLYNYILTSVLVTGFAIGLRSSEKMIQNDKKRKEAEKAKLNTELAFLKNQISPHFFFNTLNNIYVLSQDCSADAPKAVLQLSKLMRYLIYESDQANVFLSQEIDFMKNYIELMKLRIAPKVRIDINFTDNFSDILVPPLLFIPFVENAFKHGISYKEASFVEVYLNASKTDIVFECHNSCGFSTNAENVDKGRIGLDNIRKRLDLLFPGMHEIKTLHTDNLYSVSLILKLQKT